MTESTMNEAKAEAFGERMLEVLNSGLRIHFVPESFDVRDAQEPVVEVEFFRTIVEERNDKAHHPYSRKTLYELGRSLQKPS